MTEVINGELSLKKEEQPEILQNLNDYQKELKNDPEVQALTSEIDVNDVNSILEFGSRPGQELAAMSDEILNHLKVPSNSESLEMLSKLSKIMKQFDANELKQLPEKESFVSKIFNSARNRFDSIISKYDNMCKEVDDVYQLILKYEQDTRKENEELRQLYLANLKAYQDYEKYVVAADIAKEELLAAKAQLQANTRLSHYEKDANEQQFNLLIRTLENRTVDMQSGGVVAQVTVPMLLNMQQANVDLLRKYKTAFTIGIPIFKSNLSQAIMLKKQAIKAKAMNDFDETLREQLQLNAERTAQQGISIAKNTNRATFSYEDLEKAYQTISKGQQEIKQALLQAEEKQAQDRVKIEKLKVEISNNK